MKESDWNFYRMQKKIPYIAVIAHNPGLTEKPTSSVSAFHQ